VEGLIARRKYIYLCTNALLLKEKIGLFKPSKYLTFSVIWTVKESTRLVGLREGGYAPGGCRHPGSGCPRLPGHTNTTLFDAGTRTACVHSSMR